MGMKITSFLFASFLICSVVIQSVYLGFVSHCDMELLTTEEIVNGTAIAGTIASPVNENGTYLPNQKCWKLIITPPNMTIKFEFNHMDIDYCPNCRCDLVSFNRMAFSAGWNNYRPHRFCNREANRTIFPTYYRGDVKVLFLTDGKEQRSGFNVTWRAEPDPDFLPCRNRQWNGNGIEGNGMSLKITAWNGTLANYVTKRNTYRSYSDCVWTFFAQPGFVYEFEYTNIDMGVRPNNDLNCSGAEVVCNCDAMEETFSAITDGDVATLFRPTFFSAYMDIENMLLSNGMGAVAIKCGSLPTNSFKYTASTGKAAVWFSSLISSPENMTGFSLNYRQVPVSCRSRTRIDVLSGNNTGVIENWKRYDGNHNPNEKCEWVIKADYKIIRIWFSEFDLIDKCSDDYLTIIEGEGYQSKTLATFCSTQQPPMSSYLETTTSLATVSFTTNTGIEGKGFKLHYEAIDSEFIPCTYTNFLSEQSGSFGCVHRSVADQRYRDNEDCSWLITLDSQLLVELTITLLDIEACGSEDECNCDFLGIFNGNAKSSPQVAKLCGLANRQMTFVTTGNVAFVNFRTDEETHGNHTGFSVSYRAVSKPTGADDTTLILATSIPAAFFVIVCIAIFSIYMARKKSEQQLEGAALEVGNYIAPAANFRDLLEQIGASNLAKKLQEISFPSESVEIDETSNLGQGNSGIVKRGELVMPDMPDPVAIAVKVVRTTDSPEYLAEFIQEAVLMLPLDHPNILKCFGVAIIQEQPHILLPHMANGSLSRFLKNSRFFEGLDHTEQLIDFCAQISSGMNYMSNLGYLHRDLACRNVLIDEFSVPKISDFGLTRVVADGTTYYRSKNKRAIPVRWHPPESLLTHLFDTKSDVWSFGVLLWEVFTLCHDMPYGSMEAPEIIAFITNGGRLEKPCSCPSFVYEKIMLPCWNGDRMNRPSFEEISKLFDQFKSKSRAIVAL